MGMQYNYVVLSSTKPGNRIEETKRTERKQGQNSKYGRKRR